MDNSSIKATVFLGDVHDCKEGPALEAVIETNPSGIDLSFKGFGVTGMEPGHGPIVAIEQRDGVPHVIVWADINQEDPTHVISLERAAESKRAN